MGRAFKNLSNFQSQTVIFYHLETSHYPYNMKCQRRQIHASISSSIMLEITLAMYLRHMGCTQKAFHVPRSQVEDKNR